MNEVEFWGYAKNLINYLPILQNKCIRIIYHANYYAHVPILAKPLNLILF